MNDALDRLGIGGNNPPPDPFARADELIANANRWIAERPAITDAEMAGIAQDFMGQLRANRDALAAEMKAERKPHDDAIVAIRARYSTPLDLIGIALVRMGEKLAPWLRREQERLAAEERERKRAAAEAAAQAEAKRREAEQSGTVEAELEAQRAAKAQAVAEKAAAKAPERARVKGDLSPRAASLREYWHAEIIDEREAVRSFKGAPEVRTAMVAAALALGSAMAKREKRADAAPPGFRFYSTSRPV